MIVAITVVIALTLAVTIYFFVSRKSSVPINSIAVMPFVNVAPGRANSSRSAGDASANVIQLRRK